MDLSDKFDYFIAMMLKGDRIQVEDLQSMEAKAKAKAMKQGSDDEEESKR